RDLKRGVSKCHYGVIASPPRAVLPRCDEVFWFVMAAASSKGHSGHSYIEGNPLDFRVFLGMKCFSGMAEEQLKELADQCRVIKVKARTTLREDCPAFIVRGATHHIHTGKAGKKVIAWV